MKWLFEAQDLTNFDFFYKYCRKKSVDLHTPLDMYVFGYTLVHGAVQWEVNTETSLDALVSSLRVHAPSGNGIAGSITKLDLWTGSNYCIEQLPECVRHPITSLHLSVRTDSNIPSMVISISSLHNIKEFSIELIAEHKDDYLLFGALTEMSCLEDLSVTVHRICLLYTSPSPRDS